MAKAKKQSASIQFQVRMPPKALSPNARPHWAAKARATKVMREAAAVSAMACYMPGPKPMWANALAQVTFNYHTKGRRDRDNCAAMCKAIWDGVVDAGVLLDDCGLSHAPLQITVDKSKPYGLSITIVESQVGA